MSETRTITVIRHHHNAAELNDTAVEHLTARGFSVQHRFPFDGDQLFQSGSSVTPTIVLGGGQNVTELHSHTYMQDELRWIKACIDGHVPLLGICLGAQLIAHALGATVSAREPRECEYGFYKIYPTDAATDWLTGPMPFMQAHYQEFELPDGATRLAYSDRYPQQAFRYGQSTYAVQFHPEVNHTIFDSWLADTWSDEMAASKGAQSKSFQRDIASPYLVSQARWFCSMLDKVFDSDAAPV